MRAAISAPRARATAIKVGFIVNGANPTFARAVLSSAIIFRSSALSPTPAASAATLGAATVGEIDATGDVATGVVGVGDGVAVRVAVTVGGRLVAVAVAVGGSGVTVAVGVGGTGVGVSMNTTIGVGVGLLSKPIAAGV